MRIRRKKHLEERIAAAQDILYLAPQDIHDINKAVADKRYFDFDKMFGENHSPVYMEIGCGKGGFASQVCQNDSGINYLAVELLSNIAVMAAENAKKKGITNARFFVCGADYLARYIPPNSLSRIYLNFSPPFPGLRYENRRLTKPALISRYGEFLHVGGEVWLKTDDKDFFEYSHKTLADGGFVVKDFSQNPPKDIEYPATEYETKFRKIGLPIYVLKAKKEN